MNHAMTAQPPVEARVTHRTWVTTFITNGSVLLIGMGSGVLTARLLLPEGRGELATVLFWPVFFQGVGLLGLKEAITRRISSSAAKIQVVAATGTWLAVGYAALTSVIGYFVLPDLLGKNHEDLIAPARWYMLILLPFAFIALSLRSADQGRLNFAWHNTLVVGVPAVYVVALCVLWSTGSFTVENVVWANLVGVVAVATLRMVLAWRWLLRLPCAAEARQLLVTGLRFYLTAMVMLIGTQADRMVLVTFWDNASIGLYSIAATVASTGIGALSNSFQTIVFPHMGRLCDERACREYLSRQLRYAMILLSGLAALIMGLAPWVVPLIFGDGFKDAVYPTIALTLALVPFSLRQILIAALRGLGEARPGTASELIALVAFALLIWPLAGVFGLTGLPLALLAANSLSIAYLFRYMNNRLLLRIADWWGLNLDTAMQLVRIGRHYVTGR